MKFHHIKSTDRTESQHINFFIRYILLKWGVFLRFLIIFNTHHRPVLGSLYYILISFALSEVMRGIMDKRPLLGI
jgi:hypothetical protein